VRWDRSSSGSWTIKRLELKPIQAHWRAVSPMSIGDGFIVIGMGLVRLVGLDGRTLREFSAPEAIAGASWNSGDLLCAGHEGTVYCLDEALEVTRSWPIPARAACIEFITNDRVMVWGREVAFFTRKGRPTRPIVEVPGTLLDSQQANPWGIVSNSGDESFAFDVESEEPPIRIPGFVAGHTPGAVWMAGWKVRGVTGGFTRWKMVDGAFVSPSFVELALEEWRSQVSDVYEWKPGSYVLPMEGGLVVLGEREDGELTITKTIKPGKVLANAIRGEGDECVVIFADASAESVHVGP
jgi:hypothetical protein